MLNHDFIHIQLKKYLETFYCYCQQLYPATYPDIGEKPDVLEPSKLKSTLA